MPSLPKLPSAAVGLGFRVELAADLLRAPRAVDFIEIVAETCFSSPSAHREAAAVARIWPVVPHGVKLSLGSAGGVDLDRARRLGALARELRSPVITEHVAFVRGGEREIGHLTQLPFTREAARVVARNVAAARRVLPDVPLLLENAAWTFRWPDDELDEPGFYAEIVERTGCDLLLDLANLHANARNAGVDPLAVLRAYPLDRVGMIHLAGGETEGGFTFDTHAAAVSEGVFALLAEVVGRIGPVPIVLERDDNFPPFAELAAEVERARAIVTGDPTPTPPQGGARNGGEQRAERSRGSMARAEISEPPSVRAEAPRDPAALAAAQAGLAEMLTSPEAPPPDRARPFGEAAIARSREVLRRKRVDDALPLLPRLLSRRDVLRPIALACVDGAPRAPALAGVADAMRIAAAAAGDERLGPDARIDLLVLRSRFVGPSKGGSLRPRLGPFVGREQLPNGRFLWAVKGLGGGAEVRLFETGNSR